MVEKMCSKPKSERPSAHLRLTLGMVAHELAPEQQNHPPAPTHITTDSSGNPLCNSGLPC